MHQLSTASTVHPARRAYGPRPAETLFGRPELHGVSMPFARNSEIFGESEQADYVYRVLRGAVRTFNILGDGRRQIVSFYLPGDLIGLGHEQVHSCSAEAITDSQILLVRRTTLLDVAACDPEVGQLLWGAALTELKRAHEHSLLLVRNARERLANFLLNLAQRMSSSEIELPMSRQEIADHLGLTIETVSRTFTQLSESDTIRFRGSRHIALHDLAALNQLNS